MSILSDQLREQALDYLAAECVGGCPAWETEPRLPKGALAGAARAVGLDWREVQRWWREIEEEERGERLRAANTARERARALAAACLPTMIEHLRACTMASVDPREVAMGVKAMQAVVDGDAPPSAALEGITMLVGTSERGRRAAGIAAPALSLPPPPDLDEEED